MHSPFKHVCLISFSWLIAFSSMFRRILNNCTGLRYLISGFKGNTSVIYPLNIMPALQLQCILFFNIHAISIQSYIIVLFFKSQIHLESNKCFWQLREYGILIYLLVSNYPYSPEWITLTHDLLCFQYSIQSCLLIFY